MKKHALALATSALLLAPAAALAAGPTLYGQLNVSLNNEDNGTTDKWQLSNHSSRLGVKGDVETSFKSLTGLYYAEYGIETDDGVSSNGSPFTQRNIWVGLKSDVAGTFRLGHSDTPLKEAQGKVDQFNDLPGDIQYLVGGESRFANTFFYTSPKIADALSINVALKPGEGVDVDGVAGVEEGLADTTSASLVFQKGDLYLAAAAEQTSVIGGVTPDGVANADLVRLVATYKIQAIELGALVATAEDINVDEKDTGWLLSGALNAGNWKFKAQYGVNEGDNTGNEATLASLGADYKLGKSTTAYAYYTQQELDATVDAEKTTYGFGLLQKF